MPASSLGRVAALLARAIPLLAICLLPAMASAQPPPAGTEMLPAAKLQYDGGMAHYTARDYSAAIRAFEAAYALDPKREILFAQAQATRMAGDCVTATGLYQRFLATSPPPQQIEATRIALGRCQAVSASSPIPAPRPEPVTKPTDLPSKPVQTWDTSSWLLTAGGGLALSAGVGLLIAADRADDRARGMPEYGNFEDKRKTAERLWRVGLGGVVVGSTLVTAGVGRYFWLGMRSGGVSAGWGGRF